MALGRGLTLGLILLKLQNRKFGFQFLIFIYSAYLISGLKEFSLCVILPCSYALELLKFREAGVEVLVKVKTL